jgi:archaellum component FlaC
MSDAPDNLILVMLRRIDAKIDRVIDDVADLKLRMTSVERQIGEIRLELAGTRVDMSSMSARMDRMDARLERIERRLDLVDGLPAR